MTGLTSSPRTSRGAIVGLDPANPLASVVAFQGDGVGGQRDVTYLLRRFPSQPDSLPLLAEHLVVRGDRPDLIAAAQFNDPTQFWRVCDANPVIHPEDLCSDDRIGELIRIPVPQA